ncbi:carboxylesterase family protein [Nocardia sp. NPDC004278]
MSQCSGDHVGIAAAAGVACAHAGMAKLGVRTGEEVQVADRSEGHRAAQGNPAHIYLFTRRPSPDPNDLGAVHCAELPFLFGTFDAYPNASMLGAVTDSDRTIATEFGGALAAFVATGTPNGQALPRWEPYRSNADIRRY